MIQRKKKLVPPNTGIQKQLLAKFQNTLVGVHATIKNIWKIGISFSTYLTKRTRAPIANPETHLG